MIVVGNIISKESITADTTKHNGNNAYIVKCAIYPTGELNGVQLTIINYNK